MVEVSVARPPRAISAARLGRRPRSRSGSRMRQSAPSQPMRRTREGIGTRGVYPAAEGHPPLDSLWMSDVASILHRTYVRFPVRSKGSRESPDGQALRRGRGGGTGRWDAGGLLLAGPTIRGPRRDRTVADRRALVGGRPRAGVLAVGGQGRSGDRPLRGPPGGPVAPGAAVGLRT